jgi:TonB family protein
LLIQTYDMHESAVDNNQQVGIGSMERSKIFSSFLGLAMLAMIMISLSTVPALGASLPVRLNPNAPITQPSYPAESKRLDEQGTVILTLVVRADGRVASAEVETSSGFSRLDEAAISHAVSNWRFLPATENDTPISKQHTLAVKFQMIKSRRF